MHSVNRVPIIRLWDLLLVPVQGDIDDAQAEELVNDVLERVQRAGCDGLLIDLSGVWTLDSHLCSVMVRLSRSAALMGARTIVSGMRPEIAMTIQAMGISLGGIQTVATLEDALAAMGVRSGRDQQDVSDDEFVRKILEPS
ncbi:MAG: STAS domain-containing protein [Myxococcales bacterium]|nr:STAS domain-containing protein [Myxococcales bacterium]